MRTTSIEGKSDAEKIEYSYAEYIQNISNQKNSESYEEDKAYWLNKIDSLSSYPQIPMKMKLADCRDYNIVRKSAIIDSVLWGNFKETARRHKVSPSALLCTLYGRIMAKWGNQSEVLLNLTVFQRQQKNTEKIIGDFTKLLPLNLVFAKEDIWKSAERVQEQIMKELDHLSFDGTEIMRELAKRRGVFGKALLPVVFTCVLFDCPENYFERLGSIKYAVSQTPQVFLDNQITEMGGRLHISWDVVDELFEACIIDEIFLEFVEDIKRISENNKANSTNDFVTKVWGNILTKEIITKSVVPDLLKNIDLKQIKILDYAQELCPPDVKGQVYVSESEIMNDRNKTYYKILEHPLYGRMADTGIIGVLTHDGYMEFVVPNCETSVETPDKKEDTHEEEIEKPIVKEIMKIWKEVFEIEDISIQDDFYTLGGDSIILMRLVDEMCKTLGCDVTVDDILQSENIYEKGLKYGWEEVEYLWKGKLESPLVLDYIINNIKNWDKLIQKEQQATLLLFEQGEDIYADALYKETKILQYLNHSLSKKVLGYLYENANATILEIGAGTGATSDKVLSDIRENKFEEHIVYFYTDISRFFLQRAKERYKECDGKIEMHYQTLDIDEAFSSQLPSNFQADIVIAVGVLNNSVNTDKCIYEINSVMKPGGILLIIETVEDVPDILITQSFMMTEPKDQRKATNTMFLNRKQWLEILEENGFCNSEEFPGYGEYLEVLGQKLFYCTKE